MTAVPIDISARDDEGLARSLWVATAEEAQPFPTLEEDRGVDVAIVGGGFAGLSAALHLAERGVDVAVLEARVPGWGASGRNGGQVISGFKYDADVLPGMVGTDIAERMIAFGDGAADFVFSLIERHGIRCNARQGGWLQGVHGAKALAAVEAKARRLSSAGAPVEILDAEGAAKASGTDCYIAAYLDRRAGTVQPLSLARGLARAAAGAGTAIYSDSAVVSVGRGPGGWSLQTATGSRVMADRVLMCTNGYSDLSGGLSPVEKCVVPFYSYQVATKPLSENLLNSLPAQGLGVSETRRVLTYYRVDAHGRFILGARGAMDGSLSEPAFEEAKARLSRMFPRLGDVTLEYSWNGRVAITPDYLPRLMEIEPGLHAALGWNGRGVAMTIAMGPVLADWLSGTAAADLPVPVTGLRAISFHGLRRPAARALVAWNLHLDRREAAGI